jgi:hypothetical protein
LLRYWATASDELAALGRDLVISSLKIHNFLCDASQYERPLDRTGEHRTKYWPVFPATSAEEARYTLVLAPSVGVAKNGRASFMRNAVAPP